MENVFDIRRENELYYVLSLRGLNKEIEKDTLRKTAIIVYLYYLEKVDEYIPYLKAVSSEISLYIISSREDVINKVKGELRDTRENIHYILKENRGRDVSALVICGKDIVKKYKYVCFVHDKAAKLEIHREDTVLWNENLWGNTLGSGNYILNVINTFEENPNLGALFPSEPIGKYHSSWGGRGWISSFEITKKVASLLSLNCDIRIEKPPIALGTALWFRTDALRKLFEYEWKYDDFCDEDLSDLTYLSYGLERIFPYVCQDAGYLSGMVFNEKYAAKLFAYAQDYLFKAVNVLDDYENSWSLEFVTKAEENHARIRKFVRDLDGKDLYIYGAGERGTQLLHLLRVMDIRPKGFLVTRKKENDQDVLEGIDILEYDREISLNEQCRVIVAMADLEIRNEIIELLKKSVPNDNISFYI